MNILSELFFLGPLSLVMMAAVGLMTLNVGKFAYHYFQGDRRQKRFAFYFTLLALSLLTWVVSNHMVLFLGSWAIANASLVQLMKHKERWQAAYESAHLAAKMLGLSYFLLFCSIISLAYITGEHTLTGIFEHSTIHSNAATVSVILLILATLIQTAVWPWHQWLISSLNSPTPVSAFMHAGLINGGGFLLVRCAPVVATNEIIMQVLFLVALLSAIIGTIWKMLAYDVKRMLAFSTMAQMGFMMMQCGLGLFAAAVAHLIWHGFFKAYLFLSAASALNHQKEPIRLPSFWASVISFVIGIGSAVLFATVSEKAMMPVDTSFVLFVVACLMLTQLSMSFLKVISLPSVLFAALASLSCALLYGFNVWMIEYFIEPLHLTYLQPMSVVYWFGTIVLVSAWLLMNFVVPRIKQADSPKWIRLYVSALNLSQPNPKTVTSIRKHYEY